MKTPIDMIEGTIHKTNNYGDLKIVKYNKYASVEVEFVKTSFKSTVSVSSIRKLQVRDPLAPRFCGVGFIGVGKYLSREGKVKTRAYTVWSDMMKRCYSERVQSKQPTYKGCTVSVEWHNFQNFAAWFELNYIYGYQLDKDIKVKGNRIYSPLTCIFTSQESNVIASTAKNYKFMSPMLEIIEVHNLSKFCRENGLDTSNMSAVHSGRLGSHKKWTKAI